MEKTVELKISPMRVITTILTLAAFIGIIVGVTGWIFRAEISHDITVTHEDNLDKLTNIVDQLNTQQQFERKIWGDSYEQRISEILKDNPEQ